MSTQLAQFASTILSASEAELSADVTLGGRLIMDRDADVVVSYAPFEYIQQEARVVIVGITPGAQQARNALLELRQKMLAGASDEIALQSAKVFASFSGPMRANLIAMLDHIGLANWLGISSTALLWTSHSKFVNFTSALRYPVFVKGENYNGQPAMTACPPLRRMLDKGLREEAEALPSAVWIPLGPKAEAGIKHLLKMRVLNSSQILDGLPHPSGANAERVAYFVGRKARETLSVKTNATNLDAARSRLTGLVASLPQPT